MSDNDLSELLKKHEPEFANQGVYAKAIGIDVARLNRLLKRKTPHALNVINCLRFAKLTGEPASVVLRAAGKATIADLIEELFGTSAATLPEESRQVLAVWNQTHPDDREALLKVMRMSARIVGPSPADETNAPDPEPTNTPRRTVPTKRRNPNPTTATTTRDHP